MRANTNNGKGTAIVEQDTCLHRSRHSAVVVLELAEEDVRLCLFVRDSDKLQEIKASNSNAADVNGFAYGKMQRLPRDHAASACASASWT